MAYTGTRSCARSRLWSPRDLKNSLYAWYDAADLSTITLSAGKVSSWADKSINANSVTQTNSAQQPYPSLGAVNGNNVISFNGVSGLKGSSNAGLLSGSADSTWFIVSQLTTVTSSTSVAAGYGGNAVAALRGLIGSSVNGYIILWQYGSGDYISSLRWPSSFTIVGGSLNQGTGSVFTNGNFIGSKSISPFTGTSLPMSIGFASASNDQYWNGTIGEVIFASGNISLQQRQVTEGYLAWKWGLQNNLPQNHQYRSQPPRLS